MAQGPTEKAFTLKHIKHAKADWIRQSMKWKKGTLNVTYMVFRGAFLKPQPLKFNKIGDGLLIKNQIIIVGT